MRTQQQVKHRLAELRSEMQNIVGAAETGGRGLDSRGTAKFDQLKAEHELVSLELTQGVIAGRQDTGPWTQPFGWEDEFSGEGEVRALAPGESFAGHLRTAGKLEEHTELVGLTFGGMVRAMALGAKTEPERRALSAGSDSAGGYTVPDILSTQLIDKLRARSVVLRAGARTIPLLTEWTHLARIASDPTAAWRHENTEVTESDPTFERISFAARSLAVLVKVSREILEDSSNIEEALNRAFSSSLALELDRVALLGDGAVAEPLGISNYEGVSSVSMGANGAQITGYDEMLDATLALLDANAEPGTAAIMAPRTRIAFAKLKDGDGRPVQRPAEIADLPFLSTTQMPTDDTQGTASDASKIILGHFPELLIGMRSGMRIEVLRERFADNLQYGFLAHMRADVQLAHPASFAKIVGITAA